MMKISLVFSMRSESPSLCSTRMSSRSETAVKSCLLTIWAARKEKAMTRRNMPRPPRVTVRRRPSSSPVLPGLWIGGGVHQEC